MGERPSVVGSSGVNSAVADSAFLAPPVSDSGQEALDWLLDSTGGSSSVAESYAQKQLTQAGITAAQQTAQDVIQEVYTSLWISLSKPPPKELDTPAAYARTVLRNHITKIKRGQTDVLPDDLEQITAFRNHGKNYELLVRSELESRSDEDPWLTSAALTYLTLLMHPECLEGLSDLPSPEAGAKRDQALCWTALWIAGQRELFPPRGARSDPALRQKRSRSIAKVIKRVDEAIMAVKRQNFETSPPPKGAAHV